jgi:hypothetical protein
MVMGAGLVWSGWSGNSHGWDGWGWDGIGGGMGYPTVAYRSVSTKYVVKDRVRLSRDVHLHPNFCRGQNDVLSRACFCGGNGWSLVMAAEESNDRQLGERWRLGVNSVKKSNSSTCEEVAACCADSLGSACIA